MKLFRTRFGLKASMAVVFLCALVFWAVRVSRESQPDRIFAGWLERGDESQRLQAAQELGKLPSGADAAIPSLVRSLLTDLSSPVRAKSARSLADLVDRSNEATSSRLASVALLRALSDPDPTVREAAADGLGRIGLDPDATIPALLKASEDPNEWVRGAAVGSLGLVQKRLKVDRPEVRDRIARAIGDSSLHVREKGIYAFWASADRSPEFSRAMLTDNRLDHRKAAVTALSREGRLASAVIPELTAALADPDRDVREGAARSLRNAGVITSAAIPIGP